MRRLTSSSNGNRRVLRIKPTRMTAAAIIDSDEPMRSCLWCDTIAVSGSL